jgi:quinoprotein glucose dehydrogenase
MEYLKIIMRQNANPITSSQKLYYLIVLLIVGCGKNVEVDYSNWTVYNGDATSSSYSELDQINKENVNHLEIAWIYSSKDISENARSNMQTNPIIIGDVLYGASPLLKIFALDAKNGDEKWTFDPFEGERGRGVLRGLVYWESGRDKRIIFPAGNWIHALNAESGALIPEFGDSGRVDLRVGLGKESETISVRATSPGVIYKNLLIQGSAVGENYNSAPGHIRAYDVRTGQIVWTFHTIPQKGEPGFETWEDMTEENLFIRGGNNNWAGMSLDQKRGIVYIPLGSPSYDFYGGNRPGKNLYGNTLLALDAKTGNYIWHFQTIHHDLWDYDLPAPPNLLTIQKDGKNIDVVAQVTKTGFIFIFDRDTGEPIFPIEDRAVPPSNITSERAWPTQPHPTLPKPFVRQGFVESDLTDISSEAHRFALSQYTGFRSGQLFTPPDTIGTIHFPSTHGGANWGGAAHDPNTGILYVNANEQPELITLARIIEEPPPVGSLYDIGSAFYRLNCAMCHGNNLEGQHPTHPALNNIQDISTKEAILTIVEKGGGLMPAYPNITDEEKDAIIAFLYGDRESLSNETNRQIATPILEQNIRYINTTSYRDFVDNDGYPAVKPPWGTLNAIDINSGEILWQVTLGVYPELIEKGIPPTGSVNWGGPIATAGGLIFIAATGDKMFRAFDQLTGDLVWETKLPFAAFAKPATYMIDGKQYIVIAAGGGRGTESGDIYIAFSLPDDIIEVNSN